MDVDEWEFIPSDGFLNFESEETEKSVYFTHNSNSNSKSVFNMNYNYFDETHSTSTNSRVNHLVPLTIPIQLMESNRDHNRSDQTDQDSVSQVFFKKETEFVDMKLDSPKSPAKGTFVAQIDPSSAFSFKVDERSEIIDNNKKKNENEDMNIWKMSLSGIGAICSFGVAAATVCLLFFGSNNNNNNKHHHFRFQIYDDDKKRVKHSTISTVTRMPQPITRAHITFGGYYDAL